MKKFIATYWKTLLFFAIVGLVGGFFVGLYAIASYPADILQQLIDEMAKIGLGEIPVAIFLAVVTAVQSFGYGIVLGALGIFFGKKTGLWKDEKTIVKKPLIIALIVAFVCGLAIILPDVFFFSSRFETIQNSYAEKPTIAYMLASVTYGAVIEEVMLRLFFLSFVAFVLQKIFEKRSEFPSTKLLMIANVISAVLFAAGHLPFTLLAIGSSPLIIFRCFLLNGGLGLAFGYLYRKFGLRYAMIAHGGCHIVSKLIWILFI